MISGRMDGISIRRDKEINSLLNDDEGINDIKLEIEGFTVYVKRYINGTHGSHELPFITFPTILDFSKALIDSVNDFR